MPASPTVTNNADGHMKDCDLPNSTDNFHRPTEKMRYRYVMYPIS